MWWPFGRKALPGRLAAASAAPPAGQAGAPVSVSVVTTIVSPSSVTSPLTGLRAAIIHLEIVERVPLVRDQGMGSEDETSDVYNSLGVVILGDVATLRDEDGDEITIVAHRARIQPALMRRGGTPLGRVPPEVVPLLANASGRGVICYRELPLAMGDAVRLKAMVEPTQSVVATGYRSGTRVTYVARDDLAPVVLEEIFEAPAW
jgi:hypothetical protein